MDISKIKVKLVSFSLLIVVFLLGSICTTIYAKTGKPPEEYRGDPHLNDNRDDSTGIQENSLGIAWGDPEGPHSIYAWPFTVVQMGHTIQSYQNYNYGTSDAYFHHGVDMIAPNGTNVYTRSGGQVVNVENYRPGNELYWEVAILDAEGYVWQYHHIDANTIPQEIMDKFAEWQANPITGGFVPANTYIGDIVYWPVVSFGYRFNHIHLNILAAGDVYLNTMEFHTLLNDTRAPEIQAIGLLNGDTIVSGNTVSGSYGLYVQARDLFLSTVYYLPPYKTELSIDGGEWTTVWEFHDLPGGASDTLYVNDFFVPVYTCGDYDCRDFFIDLGFTPSGQRTFPATLGDHNIEVRVWDYNGNSDTGSYDWTVFSNIPDNGCSTGNGVTSTFPVTEDLVVTDVNLGVNITHATRGQVKVTLKAPADTAETTIITSSSDSYDNYDVWVDDSSANPLNDGNNDSVSEPYYDRTAGPSSDGSLESFNGKNSQGTWTVFICDNSSGTSGTVNRMVLEVLGNNNNTAPVADPQSLSTPEDTAMSITLTGSDADGDPLTYSVTSNPSHGTLSGIEPNLTYTPDADYIGPDGFTFIVNDGLVNSEPALVSVSVNAVIYIPLVYQ